MVFFFFLSFLSFLFFLLIPLQNGPFSCPSHPEGTAWVSKNEGGVLPIPSRSDYKLAQLRHRAKLKRFQLDSVLSTILDERFDITEVVSQSAQELERMEQVLPDREVRRERRKRRRKKK